MCLRVLKGIQSHLKRLDLLKSLYPTVHCTTCSWAHGFRVSEDGCQVGVYYDFANFFSSSFPGFTWWFFKLFFICLAGLWTRPPMRWTRTLSWRKWGGWALSWGSPVPSFRARNSGVIIQTIVPDPKWLISDRIYIDPRSENHEFWIRILL